MPYAGQTMPALRVPQHVIKSSRVPAPRPATVCPFQRRSTSASVLPAIRAGRCTRPQVRAEKVAEIGDHSATFQN